MQCMLSNFSAFGPQTNPKHSSAPSEKICSVDIVTQDSFATNVFLLIVDLGGGLSSLSFKGGWSRRYSILSVLPACDCLHSSLEMLSYVFAGLAFFRIAYAITIAKRQDITALSQAQIEEFRPYTLYAAAAYCNPSNTLTWSCGGPYIMSRSPERLRTD